MAHKPVDTSNVPRVRSETVLREFIFKRMIALVLRKPTSFERQGLYGANNRAIGNSCFIRH